MKIIIIRSEHEAAQAYRVMSVLSKPGIVFETFLLPAESRDKNILAESFPALFVGGNTEEDFPAHTLVLCALSGQFLDFLAGFASGSRLPFLAYGNTAADIHAAYPCFRIIPGEAELSACFEAVSAAFIQWEGERVVSLARKTLLEAGIPVNAESLAGRAAGGNCREVSLFLEAGFSPNTSDKNGVPLLNLAARKGNREVVSFLAASGAEINALAADRGSSALIDSVMARHYDIARDLVAAGADVNIRNRDGQSALILSVSCDNPDLIEFLLKADSDPDVPDSLGMSARQYAALFNKTSITALIDAYSPEKKE